ncbi:hypothetical protein BEH94_08115 [Candidatus Altiarchaeales archaeon WOR_SM1_SCG]|nr:hypothetical protein BEH94_08115 [Candidatus Altiarchaeales archaeon WOR_SM1_SCG]
MLPICDICAKTGVLCGACETKLDKGELTPLDVELSGILYNLGSGEIGFEKAIDTGDNVIIITQKEAVGKVIGKGGKNLKTLSKKLGKKVQVIGTGKLAELIDDFMAPTRIIGVNTVYKPDGSTIQKVRISKMEKDKLNIEVGTMQNLIHSLTGDNVEIMFE